MSLRTMSRTILFYKNYQKFVKKKQQQPPPPTPTLVLHTLAPSLYEERCIFNSQFSQ